MFDKFTQSSKTKTGGGGTGLGLAICKEIVEGHCGSIQAGNNPGGGAIMTVTIPYRGPRKKEELAPELRRRSRTAFFYR